MEIFLNNKQDNIQVDTVFWNIFTIDICKLLKLDDNIEISITFVNNEEIQKLNKTYRAIDKPTDVLSFPFDNSFNLPIKVLGDVVVSIEKAELQAKEYEHSITREVAFLIIHGILHLLGYDHQNLEQEEKMFSLQKKLLQNFNL